MRTESDVGEMHLKKHINKIAIARKEKKIPSDPHVDQFMSAYRDNTFVRTQRVAMSSFGKGLQYCLLIKRHGNKKNNRCGVSKHAVHTTPALAPTLAASMRQID